MSVFYQSKGFSLIELLVSLLFFGIISGMGMTLCLSSHTLLGASQGLSTEVSLYGAVDKNLISLMRDVDAHSLPFYPRIVSGDLTWSNGEIVKLTTGVKPGTDSLCYLRLASRSLKEVTKITRLNGILRYSVKEYGASLPDNDYLAISSSGFLEVHLNCTNDCEALRLKGIVVPGLLPEEALAGVTKFYPLEKRYCFVIDQKNTYRFLGFENNAITENQPIRNQLAGLTYTASFSPNAMYRLIARLPTDETLVEQSIMAKSALQDILYNKSL